MGFNFLRGRKALWSRYMRARTIRRSLHLRSFTTYTRICLTIATAHPRGRQRSTDETICSHQPDENRCINLRARLELALHLEVAHRLMIRCAPKSIVRLQPVKINNEFEMQAGGRLREAHTHPTASSAAHLMVLDLPVISLRWLYPRPVSRCQNERRHTRRTWARVLRPVRKNRSAVMVKNLK